MIFNLSNSNKIVLFRIIALQWKGDEHI